MSGCGIAIAPHPLSVEVTATEREAVLAQAREFSSWGDNIVVKVTVHGPDTVARAVLSGRERVREGVVAGARNTTKTDPFGS